ncbi:calmodulin-like protein 3 [Cyclospora cayetanensis]|uniref:Calmodulin n=1 Tax=Cyclospora cayetanensis TaxID=88456 RepID=A0A6P6RPX5_9EIME|nr:calmodulin-like protein 3 [Cyclospora cayetanensis]
MNSRTRAGRGLAAGHSASSEQGRRWNARSVSHDLAQRAPTSTIFYSRQPEPKKEWSLYPSPSAEAAVADVGEGRLGDAVSGALQDEVLECFSFFDTDGDGLVLVTEVATMLRSLGFVVLVEQARAFEMEMRRQKVTTVNCRTFSWIANKGFPRRADPVDVLAAFNLLDREKKGAVNVEELRHLLTTVGDPLSEEDWQKLLKITFTTRACATPISMKSGTFMKLICSLDEGESEWAAAAALLQSRRAGNQSLL